MPKTKRKKNPNENCLVGMACPECGSFGPFRIVVSTVVTVSDDGTDEGGDMDWDDDSSCQCIDCNHVGEVHTFREGDK